jgi:CheY-like chemotaxis protein
LSGDGVQRQHILIVDNDFDLRSALAAALTDCGYQVAVAANGLQALQLVASQKPNLVLLDMQMPVLDGHGFAQRLTEYGENVPIIVMSAFPLSREELKHIGAVAFIAKPFELDDLIRKIQERSSGRQAS